MGIINSLRGSAPSILRQLDLPGNTKKFMDGAEVLAFDETVRWFQCTDEPFASTDPMDWPAQALFHAMSDKLDARSIQKRHVAERTLRAGTRLLRSAAVGLKITSLYARDKDDIKVLAMKAAVTTVAWMFMKHRVAHAARTGVEVGSLPAPKISPKVPYPKPVAKKFTE